MDIFKRDNGTPHYPFRAWAWASLMALLPVTALAVYGINALVDSTAPPHVTQRHLPIRYIESSCHLQSIQPPQHAMCAEGCLDNASLGFGWLVMTCQDTAHMPSHTLPTQGGESLIIETIRKSHAF